MNKCASCGRTFEPKKDWALRYCESCAMDMELLVAGIAKVES